MKTNNPPEVLVGLTKEQAAFVLENCDTNIALGLRVLQAVESETTARKTVELMENFKAIKQAVQQALEN